MLWWLGRGLDLAFPWCGKPQQSQYARSEEQERGGFGDRGDWFACGGEGERRDRN